MEQGISPRSVLMRRSVLALLYCYFFQSCRLLASCRPGGVVGNAKHLAGIDFYRRKLAHKIDIAVKKTECFGGYARNDLAQPDFLAPPGVLRRMICRLQNTLWPVPEKFMIPPRQIGYWRFLLKKVAEHFSTERGIADAHRLEARVYESADYLDRLLRLSESTNVWQLESFNNEWRPPSRSLPETQVITVNEFLLAQYGEFEEHLLGSEWFERG